MARCAVPVAERQRQATERNACAATTHHVRAARWTRADTARRTVPTQGQCQDAPQAAGCALRIFKINSALSLGVVFRFIVGIL